MPAYSYSILRAVKLKADEFVSKTDLGDEGVPASIALSSILG